MALSKSELPPSVFEAISSTPEEAEALQFRDKKRHRLSQAGKRFF